MLSVKKLNMEQAQTYYTKGQENYYTHEIVGEFYGQLKEKLNLNDLNHDDFISLLNSKDPHTKKNLGAKRNTDSVPAFDFVFTPAKSLSIVYEAAVKDNPELAKKLLKFHDNAVNMTLDHIQENHIRTRVTINKKKQEIKTGNMISSKFIHNTSRELDPLLHTHCVIANVTLCEDGKYRTLDMAKLLKKDSKIVKNLGSYYRYQLKQELEKAGMEIRVTDKKQNFYELKEVKEDVIDAFSKRRKQIQKEVEKIKKKFPNMKESEAYQIATLNSRKSKKEIDRDLVRDNNLSLLKKYIDPTQLLQNITSKMNEKPKPKQELDNKALKKVIAKAENSIPREKHKTVDNIVDETSKILLLQNVNMSIERIYQIVKKQVEHKAEVKEIQEELKPLRTMHDVVIAQLRKTRFDTSYLNKKLDALSVKTTEQKQEVLENAKSRTKPVKAEYAAEINERLIKFNGRDAETVNKLFSRIKSKSRDIDRSVITERIRERIRERVGRDESQGFNDGTNRGITTDRRFIVTREELKKDSQTIKEMFAKEKAQGHQR